MSLGGTEAREHDKLMNALRTPRRLKGRLEMKAEKILALRNAGFDAETINKIAAALPEEASDVSSDSTKPDVHGEEIHAEVSAESTKPAPILDTQTLAADITTALAPMIAELKTAVQAAARLHAEQPVKETKSVDDILTEMFAAR